MKKLLLLTALSLGLATKQQAQDNKVYNTFKDTRVINTQSVEVLQKNQLDIRIMHRFGDMFNFDNPDLAGWATFYGLETAADISIGAEYGITNQLTIGLHRCKGAGPLKQNLNGLLKYRILQQSEDKSMPISMTVVGLASLSTMKANGIASSVGNFNSHLDTLPDLARSGWQKFASRLSYALEVHLARKFSDKFSLQFSPMMIWRNLAPVNESNLVFNANLAARIQITKVMGLILDAGIPLSETHLDFTNSPYKIPIGIGLEFETGGHVFQINLTNATGLMTTDYIPYTSADWLNGGWRLGFTISRRFKV